jgi:hypothetical protein
VAKPVSVCQAIVWMVSVARMVVRVPVRRVATVRQGKPMGCADTFRAGKTLAMSVVIRALARAVEMGPVMVVVAASNMPTAHCV